MDQQNEADRAITLVFPGQGSQYVGMGKEIYDACPEAREVFHQADRILGFELSALCFDGPADLLNLTENAQPAILTVSVALLRVLERRKPSLWERVRFVAGHSLGEYTAIVSADSVPFGEVLVLVRERGLQMRRAGEAGRGGMLAIVGLDESQVQDICREVMDARDGSAGEPEGAWVANHNTPSQIVVSGTYDALEKVEHLAQARGARRVVRLAVSVASHSPLMAPATEELGRLVNRAEVRPPRIPVVGNVNGVPLTSPVEIRNDLVQQLSSQVRWVESIHTILSQGVSDFIEVGPGRVLSGLIRRIDRSARVLSLDDRETGRKMLLSEGSLAWI